MGGGAGGAPFNPLENFGELFSMSQGGGAPGGQPPQPTPAAMPTMQSPGMGGPLTLFGRALQNGTIPRPQDPRTMAPPISGDDDDIKSKLRNVGSGGGFFSDGP